MSKEESMTAAQYLAALADCIVALENEDDCVGALAGHLKELMKKDILAETATVHMKHFIKELEDRAEQQDFDNEFQGIVFDLTGGDTEK